MLAGDLLKVGLGTQFQLARHMDARSEMEET